jgi:autotransporter-associated beta strand protein
MNYPTRPLPFCVLFRIGIALVAAMLLGETASASPSTWTSSGSGDWSASSNWSGNTIPGAISTSNSDIANFNGVVTTAGGTVTVDTGRELGLIQFDGTTTSPGSYTFNGGTLTLTGTKAGIAGSGTTTNVDAIAILSTVTTTALTTETFNTSIGLTANEGFENDAASANVTLVIAGGVSAATSGAKTLSLYGANQGANTISGLISDGAGTVSIALPNGGAWSLTNNNNSFSGGVAFTVAGGTNTAILAVTSIGMKGANSALGTNSTITFGGGGSTGNSTLQYIGTGETSDKNFNLNSNGNAIISIDQEGSGVLNLTGSFSSTGTSGSHATLQLEGSTASGTFSGIINNPSVGGIFNVTKAGFNTWTLSGANVYSGTTTVSAGTLVVGQSSVVSGGTLVSGAVGTGTLALSTGATFADNGTSITLANSVTTGNSVTFASTGSGSLTFDGTGVSTPSTFALGGNTAFTVNNTTIIKDVVSGSHPISLAGTGILVLSGNNTYTGATTVNGATLSIGSDSNIGGTNGAVSVSSSTAGTATVTLTSATLPTGFGVGSALLGSTVKTIVGTTVTLNGTASTSISSATNEGYATANQALTLNGGTFQANSTFSLSQTNATGAGATQNRAVTLGTSGGTVDVTAGNTLTIAGVVSGSGGALAKVDSGALILSGTNTYTGGTTISAGNLIVNNTTGSATGTGTVNLGSSGVLSGTGTISGAVSAASTASVITAGSLSSVGTLTLNGGVTAPSGLTLNFAVDGASASNSSLNLGSVGLSGLSLTFNLQDLGTNTLLANTAYTLVTGTGTFSVGSFTADLMNSAYYQLNSSYGTNGILISGDTVTFEVVAVPEPGTWALMLSGLGALILIQIRRRKKIMG